MIHNRRGGQTCGSPFGGQVFVPRAFSFPTSLDLPASKGPAWIGQTDAPPEKPWRPGKRASCFAFTCAPCFSAIPAHGIRWASKAAVPHQESFIGGFDRIGVNEKVAARSDDDEPPISGMTTGPKHSCHQLRRAECRNGLPLGKRQRTRPVERDAMRGRLSFLIHR